MAVKSLLWVGWGHLRAPNTHNGAAFFAGFRQPQLSLEGLPLSHQPLWRPQDLCPLTPRPVPFLGISSLPLLTAVEFQKGRIVLSACPGDGGGGGSRAPGHSLGVEWKEAPTTTLETENSLNLLPKTSPPCPPHPRLPSPGLVFQQQSEAWHS